MKHILKTVSRFLLLGLTASCGFFAIQGNKQAYTPSFADEEAPAKVYTEADFVDEEQTSSGEVVVSITESTTTSTSQSLIFSFKSVTLEGFKSSRSNYIISITDENYTGDVNNPVPEGYENIDAETGLPILKGAISYVIGGNNKEVCLPATITRDGCFIVEVTTILSHCVSATGEEYNGNNCWYDEYNNLKITGIYIPDTIQVVESHAFMGVPADVKIAYEGNALHEGFADDWTDAQTITFGEYKTKSQKYAGVGGKVNDLSKGVNFTLGCQQSAKNVGEEYNRPLVIEYTKHKTDVNGNVTTERVFEALPLKNSRNSYETIAETSSRQFGIKLGPGEYVDDNSIYLHNLMRISEAYVIDTSKTYFAKPNLKYSEKLDLSKLLSFKFAGSSTFAGFSIFSLTFDKNLSIVSEKYQEPHSYYLDVKGDMYEQNIIQINKGKTRLRYCLNNLYLSSYHFIYVGSNGQLKEATVPISTLVPYQELNNDKNNKVSIIVENKKVAPDFSAERVRTFELMNINVQMDLYATNDVGSSSVLGKTDISYKFAYITVQDNKAVGVFNWNIFLVIFVFAFIALYAAGSFTLYKVFKEKYKNDEFRRVNGKKFLKKAILSGLGFAIIALAILFILMRAVGFANTIVGFNPTDPLLIIFAIAGLIIGGYFIVSLVKFIKAEKERRKAIRLKLNEDVDDDGTN